ncbi:biotin-dependent carboxyltransferase family protein [Pseudomonas flexibilis]|uniref:Allophanate hydrolase n=1 Tax=Pseudomonas flexibilis TaxID=706570 RepID=A0A0B3C1B6_9PSED|nr:biotin-dependent carboxyltransferase family protein [Pseudomonas flexibilis]KHO65367.1 allophanate hydrolase [Pseudomonas flexibilis]SCX84872.1 biotin-dependent carboxylase uncharacterized domain-containing protein [Pseudomonas flexibilis]
MNGLRVMRPGALSVLQDGGRFGWQHLGVSPGGPLDIQAAAWANRLLGNPWGAALLEVALGGLELLATLDTWLAVCGAQMDVCVDGKPRPGWSSFPVQAGQVVRLGYARQGQRCYLAAAGGFLARPVLGSVAAHLREGLGGVRGDGRPLLRGDTLGCRPARSSGGRSVPWRFRPDYGQACELRVMAAPGHEAALAGLFAQSWTLSPRADRMGMRLEGEPLAASAREWSQGVVTGTIQLPPDGQPIVLMADRQTMGGYPVLGWVHSLDLGRLAQCTAHTSLRFEPVSLEDVQRELREFYRFFR